MAERRMFAKTIIDSDAFLDMSLSTQALYFHLSMRADDDGFINNPKKIGRMIGANDDEFKILLAKKFILGFESGVIVIKHWKIHNYIQKDRYKKTNYYEEMDSLDTDENNAYSLDTRCIQDDSTGKVRLELGKDSIEKSIEKKKPLDLAEKFILEKKVTQESNKELVRDFVSYRKLIKKPLKTIVPIQSLIDELILLKDLGYTFEHCIEQMKANEWQTIKVSYIHKASKQNSFPTQQTKREKSNQFIDDFFAEREANQNHSEIYEGEIL